MPSPPLLGQPVAVLAVLALNVALAQWLLRIRGLRLLGAALLVILLTALTANVGLIPSVTDGSPVYDGIFTWIAPLAIFWLLLGVDLRSILTAGAPMLVLFALGAAGTLAGVLLGMRVVGGAGAFGEFHAALGGMFAGTYIGGSLNFNAVALEFGVQREGLLFAGAGVVDNLMTTVWMVVTIVVPQAVGRWWPSSPTRHASGRTAASGGTAAPIPVALAIAEGDTGGDTSTHPADERDEETFTPGEFGALLAMGAGTVWASAQLAGWLAGLGVRVPSILILTTVALVLAQLGPIRRLRGARLCGMFAVLLFLAAIGALCDVGELAKTGQLGVSLSLFVVIVVLVHGVVVFTGARLLRIDPAVAAVASQANIGGGTSALALARSLDRADLVAPALLIGSLGTAVGTYVGLLAAAMLGG
jgi:uncharacterized membrane protein